MPTRHYVAPQNYDADQAEFTVQTVNDRHYLQIGGLDADGQGYVENLFNGDVGFFDSENRRVVNLKVIDDYDNTNGIPISGLPRLTENTQYRLKFTQPEGGRDGQDGEGGSPQPSSYRISRQHRIRKSKGIVVTNGISKHVIPRYPKISKGPSLYKVSGNSQYEKLNDGRDIVRAIAALEAARQDLYNIVSPFLPAGFSGDYNDLTNLPPIPAAQVPSDWEAASGVARILNKPTIPLDTTLWRDMFRINTAYEAGHVVLVEGTRPELDKVYIYTEDVPDTNTTVPSADSRAHQLNIGAPNTITSITGTVQTNGFMLTITRRDGNTESVQLNDIVTSANVLTALQGLSTAQEGEARTALGITIGNTWNLMLTQTATGVSTLQNSHVRVSNQFYFTFGDYVFCRFEVTYRLEVPAFNSSGSIRGVWDPPIPGTPTNILTLGAAGVNVNVDGKFEYFRSGTVGDTGSPIRQTGNYVSFFVYLNT